MQKIAVAILITVALVLVLAFGISIYGQFALDYSLENLKQALEATRGASLDEADNQAYRSQLQGLVVDEASRKDADFSSLVLLEHAVRALRDAVEPSGYTRAGVYLAEVLRERSSQRNWILRASDSLYYFAKSLGEGFGGFWTYLTKRFRLSGKPAPVTGASVLILGEAERMEREGNLRESERYYREFLERYPGRPERGFVTISLAFILTKMQRLTEAEELLKSVKNEFPGTREEDLANLMESRIATMRKRLARLPELEDWIRADPNRIFHEDGGLELVLGYIATFQIDRALSILEKLEEAPDPRVRSKALFYRGLLHKWEGDLTQGQQVFEKLGEASGAEEELWTAAQAELADISYEKREYDRALTYYETFAKRAADGPLKALSELEQGDISLFRLGNSEAAQKRLDQLKQALRGTSPEFQKARQRLEDALKRSSREEGFRALAEGRTEAALQIFKKHLEKFPRDGIVRSALGSVYLLKGLYAQAVDESEKGYGFQPDEYTASVLGYVYEKIGEITKAEQYYVIGTQIKPSYIVARFNLGVIYLTTDRYPEALKVLEGLEKGSPEPPSLIRSKLFNNRGCALWGMGKKDEAKRQFSEALKALPGFADAMKNTKLSDGGQPLLATPELPGRT